MSLDWLNQRVATPSDLDLLFAGFQHLSATSRYRRFFTGIDELNAPLIEQLSDLSDHHQVAVIGFDVTRESEVGSREGFAVGVARYVRSSADEQVAEVSIAVIDEYHRRGVGRQLLRSLISVAEGNGVRSLIAYILADNPAALGLFESLGFLTVELHEAAVVALQLSLRQSARTSDEV